MAANKELRRICIQLGSYCRGIFTGIAANMGHQYIHLFALKSEFLREFGPDIVAIDVAVYTSERFKSFQLIRNGCCTKITGMPYLVAFFKVLEYSIIEVVVGI